MDYYNSLLMTYYHHWTMQGLLYLFTCLPVKEHTIQPRSRSSLITYQLFVSSYPTLSFSLPCRGNHYFEFYIFKTLLRKVIFAYTYAVIVTNCSVANYPKCWYL